jgi:hypothetical protein
VREVNTFEVSMKVVTKNAASARIGDDVDAAS